MIAFVLALIVIWLLAHLTHRYLVQEAGILASVLVAFAFTLLAPIIQLIFMLAAAAIFGKSFDPEIWFSQIPILAVASAIITYITVKTQSAPKKIEDEHTERKL